VVIADGTLRVERVRQPPAGWLDALVEDGEGEGVRFVRRLAEEWASGDNRFERPGEALFVAWLQARAVGVGGLNIDPYTAALGVGRVRHLYVLTTHRRRGIGERLVRAIVEAAQGRFDVLRLRTSDPAAARLYERLGFVRVGLPASTHAMALRMVA
jgi:ribosomal protein S18 acetylase RimI-like enzyme